jgi:DNA mismatch repair protein MutL
MEKEYKLNILSEDVINKIAAGEVIERPSSVVKELVDNAIDAKATEITIKVKKGGIDLIEVSDNGKGIPGKNLPDIFKAHTTSKISNIEDLNNLLSLGFRGEALSTILAVADVKMVSKYGKDIANEIVFTSPKDYKIKKAAKEAGTTVIVENIFGNIPARQKFLKTPQTEYKKILDILLPYFVVNPQISFVLIKDGKEIFNLPLIKEKQKGEITKERLKEVWKEEMVKEMIEVFFDGGGLKISGLVGHPNSHVSRTSDQYIFVNNRNIWDNGIARAIYEGFDRYIPHGEKVPFVINIQIRPDLVDINVHPQKHEVRFLNPYRVYSAVTDAVKASLTKNIQYKKEEWNIDEKDLQNTGDDRFERTAKSIPNSQSLGLQYDSPKSREIRFNRESSYSVRDSLKFSKEILQGNVQESFKTISVNDEERGDIRNIFQIFNKYICIEFENNILWIVDQHAIAERITFEKLLKSKKELKIQKLLVPEIVQLGISELELIKEQKKFFEDLGFEMEIKKNTVEISALPVELVSSDFEKMFNEIWEKSEDLDSTERNFERRKEDILATLACHSSVRSGQKLNVEEMKGMYNELIKCENPYSCPHGRPAVWKLRIEDIDSNFERTY